jgi:hypothetical protein
MFDALAEGIQPQIVITISAMTKAIEYVQCAEATVMYELAKLAKSQSLYEKTKDAEKQQSLVMSKLYETFTTPDMAHQWVIDARNSGATKFGDLGQKINGKKRAALKKAGVDIKAILQPIWDELESGVKAGTQTHSEDTTAGDEVEYSFEITHADGGDSAAA